MIFGEYAQYYDLLYADKDYAAECDFLEDLVNAYARIPVKQILDLGCGTGGHALPLAQRGYQLMGVDISQAMLDVAKEKALSNGAAAEFQLGDLRNVEVERTFETVIAMFAVMSYQTTNRDLEAAFRNARRHLKPGGLFIFDGWFGPAVLNIRPSERVKMVNVGKERLIRLTRPSLDIIDHTVSVEFTVIRLEGDRLVDEVNEMHRLRFLFVPEIELLCQVSGFELIHYCPFMGPGRRPTESDWNVSWVARAV